MLSPRGVNTVVTSALEPAVRAAAGVCENANAIVFSPLFPVANDDRVDFERLIVRIG
jgi:hypothetical protein